MFKKTLVLSLFLGTPLFAGKRMKQEVEIQYDLKDQIGSLHNFKKILLKNMYYLVKRLDERCFSKIYYHNQASLKPIFKEMLCEERTNKIISFSKILKFLVSFSPLEEFNNCLEYLDKVKDADETLEETGKNILKTTKIISKVNNFTKSIGQRMHGGVNKIVKCFTENEAIKPLKIFNTIKDSIIESKEFVDFLGSIYENMDATQQHEVWQTLISIDEEIKQNKKPALNQTRVYDFFHHFSNPLHKGRPLNLLTTRSGLPINSYTLPEVAPSLNPLTQEDKLFQTFIRLLKKTLKAMSDHSALCAYTKDPSCEEYLETIKKNARLFIKTTKNLKINVT